MSGITHLERKVAQCAYDHMFHKQTGSIWFTTTALLCNLHRWVKGGAEAHAVAKDPRSDGKEILHGRLGICL